MRALITLCCTFALSTTIHICKSPTGQPFMCQQVKTEHGTTVMCAPPPKSRTST